jgi:Tol biopolymer transport system component
VLIRVGSREWLGPTEWSPDGDRIAYLKSVCPVDPGKTFCTAQTVDTLCLFEVRSGRDRCFAELRQVRSLDWSPDGTRLVIDAAGPVQVLDRATGSTSVLLPPGGTDSVRRALGEAGLGHAIQFVRPLWSASGRYVAALANLQGGNAAYVLVVVDVEGRLVAMGRPSTEFQPGFGWSPARDVLAYTKGKAPYTTTGVYLLDVETGENRRLLDTTPKTTAKQLFDVTSLAWSPSGRWLAISSSAGGALIIDTTGEASPVELAVGEVKGWAR